MRLSPATRTVLFAAGAVAVCAALAARETAQWRVVEELDPSLRDVGFRGTVVWYILYYLMWAALTPLVFFLGRHIPFRRERWLSPLASHTAASVVIAVVAPVSLAVLFGGLVLRRGFPTFAHLVSPFWTTYAAYRAIADTSMYWVILAAGAVLRTYDESQARRLQAADLERSLTAAQVDVLKMKLQPHFLFNTLNSIRFLALEKDSTAVVTTVERLANLLRASMTGGSQLVPLEEELALADEYLAIEQMRIGDRFRIVRRIDPAVRRARVPGLVLQPIVENSIKHAFSQRLDATCLEIAAFRDRDALRIVVSDDGPGLPPGWDLATNCGRGLSNVMERLNALYRNTWSLTVRPRDARGTIVEMSVPYSERDDSVCTRAPDLPGESAATRLS
jgi:two-component sensor histidine kinase